MTKEYFCEPTTDLKDEFISSFKPIPQFNQNVKEVTFSRAFMSKETKAEIHYMSQA